MESKNSRGNCFDPWFTQRANERPQPFRHQLNDKGWNSASPTWNPITIHPNVSGPYPYSHHFDPSTPPWTLVEPSSIDQPSSLTRLDGSSPASRLPSPILMSLSPLWYSLSPPSSHTTISPSHPTPSLAWSDLCSTSSAPVQISRYVPGMSLCLSL